MQWFYRDQLPSRKGVMRNVKKIIFVHINLGHVAEWRCVHPSSRFVNNYRVRKNGNRMQDTPLSTSNSYIPNGIEGC